MPRKRMPWFRFYVEAPTDRKIRRLKPEHRWVWVCVLCAARTSPTTGELWVAPGEPMHIDDLADLASVPVKTAAAAIAHMADLGLINGDTPWTVPAWADRQFESDSSTERVRASRQRRSNDVGTLQRRSSNARSNAPETETENRVNPPTPLSTITPVENRTASHGHYPYDDRPAQHPAVAQLHTTLGIATNGEHP